MDNSFLDRYTEFLEKYDRFMSNSATGGETRDSASRFVCDLTKAYTEMGFTWSEALSAYTIARAKIYDTKDETGKKMYSDEKAKVISEALPEYSRMKEAEIHRVSIEKMIFSIYALNKASDSEYKAIGNSY